MDTPHIWPRSILEMLCYVLIFDPPVANLFLIVVYIWVTAVSLQQATNFRQFPDILLASMAIRTSAAKRRVFVSLSLM